jgi:hypothetical protein
VSWGSREQLRTKGGWWRGASELWSVEREMREMGRPAGRQRGCPYEGVGSARVQGQGPLPPGGSIKSNCYQWPPLVVLTDGHARGPTGVSAPRGWQTAGALLVGCTGSCTPLLPTKIHSIHGQLDCWVGGGGVTTPQVVAEESG